MIKHISFAFLMLFMLGNAFAQSGDTTSNTQNMPVNSGTLVSYTCPMHPEVISDKPGQCPVCGMDLVKKAAVEYTCPMHPEVQSTSPGKCPKCGMDLELKSAVTYSCPMHPEITSAKPGICSICGMKLQESGAHKHKMHMGCCMGK